MSTPQPQQASSSAQMHRFFTSTIALITSWGEERGANVMACEWTMNVSYRPIRIMTVVNQSDLTHELITATGEFGVNLCSDQLADLASYAGNVSGYQEAKLADARFAEQTYTASKIKPPMLRDCILNVECVVEQTVVIGDYTAFIGRAVAGRANAKLKPLLYHQGKYFRLGEHLPKPGQA